MKRALLAGTLLALSGCGYYDTRQARDPLGRSAIIGSSLPDVLSALGKPDSVMQTGPDTAIIEYTHRDTSTGLKATVTLLGSIEVGGSGGCSMVLTVLRDGTVADVAFPQAYEDGLFTPPYSACVPLIAEVLRHPNGAGVPAGYDAWDWLFGMGKKG